MHLWLLRYPATSVQQADNTGLGVIILDLLCGREWVGEHDLAQCLNLHIKQVRRVMQYLEQEQLVMREHLRVKQQRTGVWRPVPRVVSRCCVTNSMTIHHIMSQIMCSLAAMSRLQTKRACHAPRACCEAIVRLTFRACTTSYSSNSTACASASGTK